MPKRNEAERLRWTNKAMVDSWPRREQFTDAVTPYLLRALAPKAGETIVDIGCGGGKTTVAIAAAVRPRGNVVGADISSAMLRLAKKRADAAKAANITLQSVDVQGGTIKGGPFNAATSQFGVMFFEDPAMAFTNIRKHLKKGGRFVFACWQPAQKNTWFPGPALAAFAPPPPPPAPGKMPTGPFQLGDPKLVRSLLSGAGFVDIKRSAKTVRTSVSSDAVADEATVVFMGVPKSKQKQALAALNKHMTQFRQADGSNLFELNFQVYSARNP